MDDFKLTINKAVTCINENKLAEAENYLKIAISQNVSSPETHNLLGVLYECRGDGLLAAKHYRAAYALDPTFKPATQNLHRITRDFSVWNVNYDLGNNYDDDDKENEYFIEYDANKVGHIRKRSTNENEHRKA